jgi:hypothetical protein
MYVFKKESISIWNTVQNARCIRNIFQTAIRLKTKEERPGIVQYVTLGLASQQYRNLVENEAGL